MNLSLVFDEESIGFEPRYLELPIKICYNSKFKKGRDSG